MHYNNHLHIFYLQKRYLCLANKKPLIITHNLYFKKKGIEMIQLYAKYIFDFAEGSKFFRKKVVENKG